MIQVYVNARAAVVKRREKLTSGTVGLKALFEFDSAWEGLYPIFNFNGSGASVDAGGSENVTSTDHTVEVTIPHECLTEYGGSLTVGVYGARVTNSETVLAIPTIYATLGQIEQGTEVSGETSAAATPTAVQQILSAVGTMNQWDNISGKPSAYPPSAHNHAQADVTGLTAALAGKQATIADLSTIRSGAALGATALQEVPSTYRTAAAQDAIHDATKQDKLIAGDGITIAADGKTISSTGGGGSSAWSDITGKPSTFPPSAHEHTVSEISDFPSIPTDNVELANGAGYVTSEYHDESKQDTLTLGRNMSYDSDGKLTSRSARLALYNGTSIIISGSTPATFDEVWNAVMHEDGINASPKTNLYLRHSSYGDVYWLSSFGHVSGTRVLSWTAVNTNGVYTVLFKATGELTETEYSPHAHDNKTVLDGITAAKVAAWDACVADYQAALGVI